MLVGPEVANFSAPAVRRLKTKWSKDYETWRKKPLDKDRWVYLKVDGIYSRPRAKKRLCMVLTIGVHERVKSASLSSK